ncbi:MAG: YbhB/YbcL family Raf kinase inhibitor-like protein [Candidatus Colwellbacteria bacterium]
MKISSPSFEPMGLIPSKYTCDGGNINPPLKFSDIPEGAVSFVLVVEDPDVPKNVRADGMFNHWLMWNMPGQILGVEEGIAPPGVEGKNTRGDRQYTGPCPPDREHRYFFKLYALDIELDLDPESVSKEDIYQVMEGRVLAEAELMGRYGDNRQRS